MYGKVFDSIYDGTLYGHWEAIATMQQFIVLATPDGVVDMTPQAIAARTSFPLDLILKGIKILSEPDPYTRTPGEEGRRIVLIDDHRPWGWRIVNHGKYMRLRDMKQKREADRTRIAEKRSQNIDVAIESQSVANVAHSDSDSDLNKDNNKEVALRLPEWLPAVEWKALLEVRKSKKAVNTPRALMLLLTELTRLKSLGFDPAKVLDQSTLKGWKSVFPLKPELVSVTAEPVAQLCDYCTKVSTGTVNGRRSCSEHWGRAMDNERPAKVAA